MEIDGGIGHKKPSRKGRKKVQTVHKNPAITVEDHERFGSMGGNDAASSESNVEQTELTSLSGEAQRNSASVSLECVKDGSVFGPGSANYTAVVTPPSEKRTKLIVAEHLLMEGVPMGHVVTREDVVNIQPTYPIAPLATKIYHSQRNLRLRLALNHFYCEALKNDHCNEDPRHVQEIFMLPSLVPSPKDVLQAPQSIELLQEKKDAHSLASDQEPDQNLAGSSELCSEDLSGYTSAMNFPNQFRDANYSRSTLSIDASTVRKMRKRYLSTAYPCTGNSGTALGNIQKPGGSVPVV